MGFGDNWLVRPGTLFMIVLIAVFGLGIYSWASSSLSDTGQKSLEESEKAVKCSNLEIELVEFDTNETHTEVFFKSNSNVEEVYVYFEGSENVTRTVESVSAGSINRVTAPLPDFERVSLGVEGCERVFR